MHTYTYTLKDGWGPTLRAYAVPPEVDDLETLGDWLFAQGFRRLSESSRGRCDVGHFFLWHTDTPSPDWPRYAIEVDQVGAESLVWIDALPDLWEFIVRYGGVGQAMATLWEGDETPGCPDCGEPMPHVSPLRLLRPAPLLPRPLGQG